MAALFALLLLTAGVAMAAPSIDSETTVTSTTSAYADGETQTTFNASDGVNLSTIQASYATTKPEIRIIDPETDTVIKTVTNASDPGYFTKTGDDGTTYYYNTTFAESDFERMPMAANENKSVTLRFIDNSSLDDPTSSDMTNTTVYLENTDERTVLRGDAGAMEFGSDGFSAFGFNWSVDKNAELDQSDVTVDGDNTSVILTLEDEAGDTDTSVQQRFANAVPEEVESGDWLKTQQVYVDGTPIKVFYDSAPSDAEGTYGVYDEDANLVRVELGEEFADDSSVDIRAVGNNKYGWWTLVSDFGAFW
ncbi:MULTISPECIES: hypothetical protein [Salinibaculum]|uniref:hypothetical protein n=1 Tax=Salinibaculum TaxID=2732368 RepID=UPI0030D25844